MDIEQPRFTQAEVLDLVPSLPARSLQNWLSRGVIKHGDPTPGRQAKRLHSGIGVAELEFMALITQIGIFPSVAADLAKTVGERARVLHNEGSKAPYSKAFIYMDDGKFAVEISNKEFSIPRHLAGIMITVEIDSLILAVLSRVYRAF